eukprot:TRINITY_DN4691_c0_g1_i1.p1 TRINITY_DN4691_c0_g1~~TRINITY_DN4691_c0_g1_i1.p1  ORF type:complete len:397 (+),score=100.05 TRINITY_DN4691_c0_g1_i1:34-1191(+)
MSARKATEIQSKLTDKRFKHFTPYPSIENHSSFGTLDDLVAAQRSRAQNEWVGVEKVHGANFSMVTNGVQVKFGKRTAFLKQTHNFYGVEKIIPEYEDKMIKLFDYVKSNVDSLTVGGERRFDFSNIECVRIYGELYGGSYPHDDVRPVGEFKAVQKGVWYTPNLMFYGFDLMVGSQFLSFAKACEIFEACDIPYGKPIVRGTLAEVLDFDVESCETSIPLPPIGDNIAEGIVIREWDSLEHVLIKKKAEIFKERTGAKIPKGNVQSKQSDGETLMTDEKKTEDGKTSQKGRVITEVDDLASELETYFNNNRLDSVLSKEEPPRKMKDLKPLIGKLARDALKDFNIDYKKRLKALTEEQRQSLMDEANVFAKSFVQKEATRILHR